ncbi:PARP10_14_15 [Mytilus edulis]|uniref:PARP10_14_15 n=1 Tax=Mytilus edulis TaxID=6550 RepID=A0A8S3QUV0_MYTED|nr:PARP10_14_15 [Mytilus edulis]
MCFHFQDINHCDVEQRRPWKAERQRYQKEDSTNYNLEEQRRRALDKSLGNYNDINDYNEEERRGWRGGKQGHQKEDKTHYDFVKSWWAQDEQQGYYKKPTVSYIFLIDFKERWTGDHTNENLKVIPLDENCYEYITVEESFKMNNENFRIVQGLFLIAACFYGEGVYFATEPLYSSNDIYSVPDENGDKFVYKCSVFVGRFGQGGKDLKEPPRDINIVDTIVQLMMNDPKIHVMFRDNQAYPEYLIQFNRARY